MRSREEGAQPAFPPNVVVEVKPVACELPMDVGVPLARWSLPDLRREVVARGLVATVSALWRQMIVNYNTDISQFLEWSGTGFRPVDETNEAYKLGVNYIHLRHDALNPVTTLRVRRDHPCSSVSGEAPL